MVTGCLDRTDPIRYDVHIVDDLVESHLVLNILGVFHSDSLIKILKNGLDSGDIGRIDVLNQFLRASVNIYVFAFEFERTSRTYD